MIIANSELSADFMHIWREFEIVVLNTTISDNGNLIDLNVFPDENSEVDDEYKFHYGKTDVMYCLN